MRRRCMLPVPTTAAHDADQAAHEGRTVLVYDWSGSFDVDKITGRMDAVGRVIEAIEHFGWRLEHIIPRDRRIMVVFRRH